MEPIWGGWRKRSITAWVDATKSFLRYQRLALLACWSRASARVARRSILLSSVPADLPSHMPSCPSAWLQGRQRQMEPEEVKKKKKKKLFIRESGHYDCFPEAPLEWNQAQWKVLRQPIFTFSADPRGEKYSRMRCERRNSFSSFTAGLCKSLHSINLKHHPS